MTDVEPTVTSDVEMKEETKVEESKIETTTTTTTTEDVEMKTETATEEVKDTEMKEEVKEPEVAVEKEEDEPTTKAKRYSGVYKLTSDDATVNALVSTNSILSGIGVVSWSSLLAGARANVGIKSGRYMCESNIMTMDKPYDIRIGFSLTDASHMMGDKDTIGFQLSSNKCTAYSGTGETKMLEKPKQLKSNDNIGVLINRTDKGNANTVSLFINGARHGEPIEIPESFKDQVMIPHLCVSKVTLELNTYKEVRATYPFTCRNIGNASNEDVAPIKLDLPEKAEVVVPIGNITKEWVDKYLASNPGRIVNLTAPGYNEWVQKTNGKSKDSKFVDRDFQTFMEKVIFIKNRKYLVSFGNNLVKKDRKQLATRMSKHAKVSAYVDDELLSALPKTSPDYKSYSIPMNGPLEGFNGDITYSESVKKSKDIFKTWITNNRAHSKVDGLKASNTFKEKLAVWKKFVAATKKEEKAKAAATKAAAEGKDEVKEEVKEETKEITEEEAAIPKNTVDIKEWTPEDWMLCELRYELHLLTQCFKTDVETLIIKQAEEQLAKAEENKDSENNEEEEDEMEPPFTSFTLNNMDFYYKAYAGTNLNPKMWGVKQVKDICVPIKDTICFSGESEDVVTSTLGHDADFVAFVELTEQARQERHDRLTAGDEKAELLFKAPVQKPQQIRQGGKGGSTTTTTAPSGKGNKGGFGNRDNNRAGYGNKGGYGGNQGRNNTKGDSNKGNGKGKGGADGANKMGNMKMLPTAGVKRQHDGGNDGPAKRFNAGKGGKW